MKLEILTIGRNREILDTVIRLINKNPEWNATGTQDDEEAIALFHQRQFEIVLLGGGIEEESEKKLRAIFGVQQPGIIIIQHFGGGSGLLENEIREALDKRRKHDITITDNIFKSL